MQKDSTEIGTRKIGKAALIKLICSELKTRKREDKYYEFSKTLAPVLVPVVDYFDGGTSDVAACKTVASSASYLLGNRDNYARYFSGYLLCGNIPAKRDDYQAF